MKRTILVVIAGLVSASPVIASAQTLDVGDQAPPLRIDTWVKGESFELEEVRGKKVVVVEFWASWCGPCIASIPHLTELQKQYKGEVIVVGVTSKDPRNSLGTVKSFVGRQGNRMDYTVAFDDGRETSRTYMQAAGMNGIPTAFVIDRSGNLAWIGSPFGELDDVVAQAVRGTLDLEEMRKVTQAKRDIDLAFKLEDWTGGIEAIERYAAMVEPSVEERANLDWQEFECLAKNRKTRKKGRKFGEELVRRSQDANVLYDRAWTMLTDDGYRGKFDDLALTAAEKANSLSEGKNPMIVDTLARALFLSGDIRQAIEMQKKAIGLAGKEDKGTYEEALREYESAGG